MTRTQNTVESSFLTPNQAADFLNVSLSTLKKLIYQNKIKTFKTPGGHHRILKSDLLNRYHDEEEKRPAAEPAPLLKQDILLQATHAFSLIMESRQKFGRGHAAAVSEISVAIARVLELSEADIETIAKASLLHDIGMLTISESIINKEKSLSSRDMRAIKQHPLLGAEILGSFDIFSDIVQIIKQHHERPDGLGYPYGLKNGEIDIRAKIIALAESFDCMTAGNSYQRSLGFGEATERVKQAAGTQFDAEVVRAFLQVAWDRK